MSKNLQLKYTYKPITWEQCHWSATTVTTGAEEIQSGKRKIKFRAWLSYARYINASITVEVPSANDPRGGEVLSDSIIHNLLLRLMHKLLKYTQVTEQFISNINITL
jgi:hypothetical protein